MALPFPFRDVVPCLALRLRRTVPSSVCRAWRKTRRCVSEDTLSDLASAKAFEFAGTLTRDVSTSSCLVNLAPPKRIFLVELFEVERLEADRCRFEDTGIHQRANFIDASRRARWRKLQFGLQLFVNDANVDPLADRRVGIVIEESYGVVLERSDVPAIRHDHVAHPVDGLVAQDELFILGDFGVHLVHDRTARERARTLGLARAQFVPSDLAFVFVAVFVVFAAIHKIFVRLVVVGLGHFSDGAR